MHSRVVIQHPQPRALEIGDDHVIGHTLAFEDHILHLALYYRLQLVDCLGRAGDPDLLGAKR